MQEQHFEWFHLRINKSLWIKSSLTFPSTSFKNNRLWKCNIPLPWSLFTWAIATRVPITPGPLAFCALISYWKIYLITISIELRYSSEQAPGKYNIYYLLFSLKKSMVHRYLWDLVRQTMLLILCREIKLTSVMKIPWERVDINTTHSTIWFAIQLKEKALFIPRY